MLRALEIALLIVLAFAANRFTKRFLHRLAHGGKNLGCWKCRNPMYPWDQACRQCGAPRQPGDHALRRAVAGLFSFLPIIVFIALVGIGLLLLAPLNRAVATYQTKDAPRVRDEEISAPEIPQRHGEKSVSEEVQEGSTEERINEALTDIKETIEEGLAVVHGEEKEPQKRVPFPELAENPNWPEVLALMPAPGGSSTRWVLMEFDGKNQRELPDDYNAFSAWCLSPDLKKVAFVDPRKDGGLFIADAAVTSAVRIPDVVFGQEGVHFRWSPDSKKLVFHAQNFDNLDIFTVNSDGSGKRAVTSSPYDETAPDWSTDGKFISFFSSGDKIESKSDWSWGVAMPVEIAKPKPAAPETSGKTTRDNPNGSRVQSNPVAKPRFASGTEIPIYRGCRGVYGVAADGGQPKLMAATPDAESLTWLPGGRLGFMMREDLATHGHSNMGTTKSTWFSLNIAAPESGLVYRARFFIPRIANLGPMPLAWRTAKDDEYTTFSTMEIPWVRWSPDGSRFLFTIKYLFNERYGEPDYNGHIFLAATGWDGIFGDLVQVGSFASSVDFTANPGPYRYGIPFWSPDGKHAFTVRSRVDKGGFNVLCALDLDMGETKPLFQLPSGGMNFFWARKSSTYTFPPLVAVVKPPEPEKEVGETTAAVQDDAKPERVAVEKGATDVKTPTMPAALVAGSSWLGEVRIPSAPTFRGTYYLHITEVSGTTFRAEAFNMPNGGRWSISGNLDPQSGLLRNVHRSYGDSGRSDVTSTFAFSEKDIHVEWSQPANSLSGTVDLAPASESVQVRTVADSVARINTRCTWSGELDMWGLEARGGGGWLRKSPLTITADRGYGDEVVFTWSLSGAEPTQYRVRLLREAGVFGVDNVPIPVKTGKTEPLNVRMHLAGPRLCVEVATVQQRLGEGILGLSQ